MVVNYFGGGSIYDISFYFFECLFFFGLWVEWVCWMVWCFMCGFDESVGKESGIIDLGFVSWNVVEVFYELSFVFGCKYWGVIVYGYRWDVVVFYFVEGFGW